MPGLTSRTIKGKLTTITLLTSCVVLLLASTVFVGIQTITYRRDIVHELETITTIIGSNSTAAVVFDDREAGRGRWLAVKAPAGAFMSRRSCGTANSPSRLRTARSAGRLARSRL